VQEVKRKTIMDTQIIYPLKDNWRIDEDRGSVPDQIQSRVNSEANYEWARAQVPLTPKERRIYYKEIAKDYAKI